MLLRTASEDKTPSQDTIDGECLENGLPPTTDSQEEIKGSQLQEDSKDSQEESKRSTEVIIVAKPARKNVRQAAKKDSSSSQATGKVGG